MTISFKGEYKSLKSFESESLDSFSVITGKNGCGKSQLIELIGLKKNKQLTPILSLEFNPNIEKIQIEGIENGNLSILNNSHWKTKVNEYSNIFNTLGRNTKMLCEFLIQNKIWFLELNKDLLTEHKTDITADKLEELIINTLKEIEPDYFMNPRSIESILARLPQHRIKDDNIEKACLVAKFVASYREKKIEDIIEADFYLTPIPDYFLDSPKLFGSQLEYVFYNYAKRRDQNRRLYFEKKEDNDENNSISDGEFVKMFIPPWESINEILSIHGLQFKFKGIQKKEFSPDTDISFQLIKTSIGKDIEFQHLSSGEKVIIGLIIKLFTSYYYSEKLEFPELVILDEPDAHLHPEMSKLLIDVLNGTFVQKLGIKVIIVTHSPSTIALCPENSIYQLTNEPDTSLVRIEKNEALRILTEFIPTLSIDYKNHKQVFVESPTDIRYYQTIFNKLNQERNYPFRLYFMSNSYGKGSCEQVIKIVDDIRTSGNTTSYGVIDWDLKNPTSEYVKVHGINKRYNIENYLYDPIYLSILFMNLKAHGIFNELGIEETINQYSIGNESVEFLQRIVDWFFSKYYKIHAANTETISKLTEVEYLNGKKIYMPSWFLEFQGHDYETRLKQVFPALNKFTGEGQLQQEITLIIGKCYPFIPKDSELLIEEIINGG